MQSSAETMFETLTRLYENIYNLLSGFQEASNTNNSTVIVNIKNSDGTISPKTITSFQTMQRELNRLDANYKSLINADNLSYTLEADGTISQQTKTTFINAEYLDNFIIAGDTCVVDKTSNLKDLVFPNVKVPITINSKLRSDIFCKTFEVSSGWDQIPENITLLNLQYLITQGKVIAEEVNRSLPLEKNQVKYFGKFTTISVVPEASNVFTIILSDIKYNGLFTIGANIDLKVNDILVSKTGSSKYIINSIDKILKTLKITRIAGSEIITVGTDNLCFNETLDSDSFIVGVPVKPSQQIVTFLSTENFKNISFPSNGIKIDTASYKVIYNSVTYTLDEFFGEFVTNFSAYLSAFIDETAIPASLGIIPKKPVLNTANFKVIQINKHLSNSKSVKDINTLNLSKLNIQNEITFKQTSIDGLQKEIDTQTFKSTDEKNYKLNQIISLKQQINILKTNLLSIANEIDNSATINGLKNIIPKYTLIGFWPVQVPMSSPQTANQHIIKYEILYRYLNIGLDTVENTSYSMIDDNGNSVTVAFSPWNNLETISLNKIKDDLGNYSWESQSIDSVDEININQCSIPIQEGEAIEIKIRAISEAGYPLAPIKSEWSEVLRYDFPLELTKNSIASTISQNNIDLNKAEFDNILQSYGILSHIANQITEAEKTFLHNAPDITSGQYTPEQKNIPLDVCISTIFARIKALESSAVMNTVTISIIDFNNENYSVSNNTTMSLFAGNYSDSINLLDKTKWGSIIRKKGFIKIKNNNSVPIELKSLVPGTIFDAIKAANYYNVPVKSVDDLLQKSKQILYFRNVDLTGQNNEIFKLVKPKLSNSSTIPVDIDTTATDADKNVIYYDDPNSIVKTCKLKSTYNTDFVAFTTEHPRYNINSLSNMLTEFDRLKLYTDNIKAQQYQDENADILGFNDYDYYSIGRTTCGAFFYPVFSSISAISVIGDTTIATLIIPKDSEILIPFVFEYRMIDRFGNIDGIFNQDANIALEYSKKIGIDLLLPDNSLFKFDINCNCKLKSKISTADTSSVSSLISNYIGENPASLT